MSEKPLISVVVPARNEEKYLPGCLKALSEQDYSNFEIVVIDNGSEDKTSRIARKFTKNVFFEEKVGVSNAQRLGFGKSKGVYIVRVDADSIPPRDWLTRIEGIFRKKKDVVAVSGSAEFDDQGEVVRYSSRVLFWLSFYITRLFFGHYQLSEPSMAIRKKALEGINFHMDNTKIHEGMDMACHLAVKGNIIFKPFWIMPISGRRLKSDPGHLITYLRKSLYSYFLHHPIRKLHQG